MIGWVALLSGFAGPAHSSASQTFFLACFPSFQLFCSVSSLPTTPTPPQNPISYLSTTLLTIILTTRFISLPPHTSKWVKTTASRMVSASQPQPPSQLRRSFTSCLRPLEPEPNDGLCHYNAHFKRAMDRPLVYTSPLSQDTFDLVVVQIDNSTATVQPRRYTTTFQTRKDDVGLLRIPSSRVRRA